jgi:hypothetical protein
MKLSFSIVPPATAVNRWRSGIEHYRDDLMGAFLRMLLPPLLPGSWVTIVICFCNDISGVCPIGYFASKFKRLSSSPDADPGDVACFT